MKNKKGFTLVELLAVIVILSVIALIATPTVLSMINNARQKSAEQSMLTYVQQIENAILVDSMSDGIVATGDATLASSGKSITVGSKTISIDIKGDAPKTGNGETITINSDGAVSAANLKFGNYFVHYTFSNNNEVSYCSSTSAFPTSCPVS